MEYVAPIVSRVVQMDELERSVLLKSAIEIGIEVELEDPTRSDLIKMTGNEFIVVAWVRAFESVRSSPRFKLLRELKEDPK